MTLEKGRGPHLFYCWSQIEREKKYITDVDEKIVLKHGPEARVHALIVPRAHYIIGST